MSDEKQLERPIFREGDDYQDYAREVELYAKYLYSKSDEYKLRLEKYRSDIFECALLELSEQSQDLCDKLELFKDSYMSVRSIPFLEIRTVTRKGCAHEEFIIGDIVVEDYSYGRETYNEKPELSEDTIKEFVEYYFLMSYDCCSLDYPEFVTHTTRNE